MTYEIGKHMTVRDLMFMISQLIDTHGPEALDYKVMLEQESMMVGSKDESFQYYSGPDKEFIKRCEDHIESRRNSGWTIETGLGTLYDSVYEECAGGITCDEGKQMVFINIDY